MLKAVPNQIPEPARLTEQPGRMLALGGAVVVCLATFGGALGVVPGAQDDGGRATRAAAEAPRGQQPTVGDPSPTGLGTASDAARRYAPDGTAARTQGTGEGRTESQALPDPSLPEDSGDGRRIVFSESRQRVWLVNDRDKVLRTYLVSGSKHDNLDPGHYEVYSMSRHAVAFNYRETMNYMVRFTAGENAAIGFHDLPARKNGDLVQTRDQLGTPLSSGCIRQWKPDARALWKFARVGTSVDVVA